MLFQWVSYCFPMVLNGHHPNICAFSSAVSGEVDTYHDAPTPEIFWTKYHAHRRSSRSKGCAILLALHTHWRNVNTYVYNCKDTYIDTHIYIYIYIIIYNYTYIYICMHMYTHMSSIYMYTNLYLQST